MECPRLADLPAPPAGAKGWPWTEEAPRVGPEVTCPRVTLVTPSYMQGQFLEETLRSVLLQGYPDLEYFVIDGGSTDQSVEIIRRYEPWLAGWVSEKDDGHPAAVNKGWRRATGEILAYINSDDWYFPGAIAKAAAAFQKNPQVSWLSGEVCNGWESGADDVHHTPHATSLVECLGRKNYGFHQPGMFWRRSLMEKIGYLSEERTYSYCHDFFIRSMLAGHEMLCLPEKIAFFRWHRASQTRANVHGFLEGDWKVFHRYEDRLNAEDRGRARRWLQEYEADNLLRIGYSFLLHGDRGRAIGHTLKRWRLWPLVQPPRAVAGLMVRALVTGRPPAWFTG
jgi:glycosyltransferase involved in cell wall biosynthesis